MNWPHIIERIQTKRGLTQPQIAAASGCAQATISDLATGKTKEPRHSLGESLISLLDEAVEEVNLTEAKVGA